MIIDVGDQNDQNCHQHLKVVTNTFCLQHPSPTSMSLLMHVVLISYNMLDLFFEQKSILKKKIKIYTYNFLAYLI